MLRRPRCRRLLRAYTSEDYAVVRFKRAHQRVWLLQFGGKTRLPKHAQTHAVFGQGGIA